MKIFYIFLSLFLTFKLQAQNTIDLAKKNLSIAKQQTAFEENKGQIWDFNNERASYVKYHFQQKGIDIFMLPTGLAYQFTKVDSPKDYEVNSKDFLSTRDQAIQSTLIDQAHVETYRMDMELVNANPNPIIIADGKSKDYVQYYNRNALEVHSFSQLTYQDVYPGIDWVIYSTDKGLKYDFIVQPGADPKQIQLRFKDHEDLKINVDGSFTVSNRMGSVTEQAPISFQDDQVIETAFMLDQNVISFELGNYDPTELLTIDPSLLWASYYGGNDIDATSSCTVDTKENVYLVGSTYSATNIASGGHQNSLVGSPDAFIVKFSNTGTRLWASYYGDTNIDRGVSCAVDIIGNIYLVGHTQSSNNIAFGGHQNSYGGAYLDAFIVKFSSAGTRLWASYYGGNDLDSGLSCAVDSTGNIYMAGYTESATNIAWGGHQDSLRNGQDAFIVKFSPTGTRLWASYYGGNSGDIGHSCSVDANGNVYLIGETYSDTDIAFGGHQNSYIPNGSADAFIVKFSSSGTRLWASYYGGFSKDIGYSCSVDPSGNVYLAGYTQSNSNIASGGHQNSLSGNQDAFIVKFNSSGTRLWASYYGGMDWDSGNYCTTDTSGNVYLIGTTFSNSSIASNGYQNTFGGFSDAFIVKFSPTGTRLWASYYGGSHWDYGTSCAIDRTGKVYLTGDTQSNSNIAFGGHQNTYGGGQRDAFIAKFCIKTGVDIQTACNSYTWIDGNTYTTNNNSATHTLNNSSVCDSVVTLDLTINTVDLTTSLTGTTATANAIGATYQWLDCNNNYSIIGGSNNQSFSPTQNGDYAVMVTENGCVDTSSCITIIVVGINALTTNDNINIYPNPTSENIHIDFGTMEKDASIKIYNTSGKLIQYQTQIQSSLYQLELPEIAGVYFLEISTQKGFSYYKVIKE